MFALRVFVFLSIINLLSDDYFSFLCKQACRSFLDQIIGALANENGGLAVLESCGRHSFFLERLEKGAIMMRADTLGGINASSQSKP
jgi:ATP/maltotriose-dependent transcriptional regulator MalT